MKITKARLKQIIREELEKVTTEGDNLPWDEETEDDDDEDVVAERTKTNRPDRVAGRDAGGRRVKPA